MRGAKVNGIAEWSRTGTALFLLALIAGCGPTGYTRANDSAYGYDDRPMGNDEYAITVTGNSQTSQERVAGIALLRAAHLAMEQQRTHFAILSGSSQQFARQSVVITPIGVPLITPYNVPHAILLIRLLPNDGPHPPGSVDAATVIAGVGPRLK